MGIGGPVGSGKTALINALCKKMKTTYQIAVVTNDIYTKEDAQFLIRNEALPEERIRGVETGGCLDDTNIRADGEEANERVMRAWEETKEFDKRAGPETNKEKTRVYTTRRGE